MNRQPTPPTQPFLSTPFAPRPPPLPPLRAFRAPNHPRVTPAPSARSNCDLKICDFGLARLEEETSVSTMTVPPLPPAFPFPASPSPAPCSAPLAHTRAQTALARPSALDARPKTLARSKILRAAGGRAGGGRQGWGGVGGRGEPASGYKTKIMYNYNFLAEEWWETGIQLRAAAPPGSRWRSSYKTI